MNPIATGEIELKNIINVVERVYLSLKRTNIRVERAMNINCNWNNSNNEPAIIGRSST
ncbi:MAG: hypothetical protein ACFE9L_17855 [Candidatus Hodarchaeota archaeon]